MKLSHIYDCRAHNAVFYCADITDWRAQEHVYSLAEKHFERKVDILIVVAGILDSSGLVNDIEQGVHFLTYSTLTLTTHQLFL